MLKTIQFCTFYYFLISCLILIVWTYFFVPETIGVPIEEMDAGFGRNQDGSDMERMVDIRRRFGIPQVLAEEMAMGSEIEEQVEKGDEVRKGFGLRFAILRLDF